MGIIEATRILGAEIQKDERFIRYAKAKLANDTDVELQNAIGEFNITRMELEREASNGEENNVRTKELNEKLRGVYAKIMSAPAMVEYNTAKVEVDSMVAEINTVISTCLDGEDPETCDTSAGCTGSCSTCGGCH